MPNTPIAPVAAPAAIASTGPAPDPRPHRADGGGGVPGGGAPAGPRPHGAGEPAADATRGPAPADATRSLVLPADLAPVALLGAHDEVLRAIERGFPEVRIHLRGTVLTVAGAQPRVDVVILLMSELIDVARAGTPLTPDAVERAIGLLAASARPAEVLPAEVLADDVLTVRGTSIRPKSLGQKAYTDAIEASAITFGIGPAGTGKTYLAMAKAVDALARGRVSRIILTRPAVEAGESLGFLPGSLTDKIDPYLRPLYDALHDMLAPDALPRLLAAGTIEVAPLAYMRGRTLNNAFVILDEAQNTSPEQMKMFLTRLGAGSKMVVTGDVSQVDLPDSRPCGLVVARRILDGVDGISFCELGSDDVVRHRLVGRIIDAYSRYDAEQAAARAEHQADGARRRGPRRRAVGRRAIGPTGRSRA